MANTLYLRRYVIVARSDLAAKANLAAKQPDTDPVGGDKAFTVPLSATGDLPATAFWCNWALTTAQAAAIRTRLQAQGATAAETTPIVFGQTPASNRFAVFDVADGWDPETVLTACGLKRIAAAP